MRFYTELDPNLPHGSRVKRIAIFSPSEWQRMKDKLDEPQKERERKEAEIERERKKKENSHAMTQYWKNTPERIQKDREKRKEETLQKREEMKLQEYREIMEKRSREKLERIEKAKETYYDLKDSSKTLVSALIASSVEEERRRQVELKKKLDEKRKMKDAEYHEKLMAELAKYKGKDEAEFLEKRRQLKEGLQGQMEERKEKLQLKEKQKKIEREEMDYLMQELKEEKKQERLTKIRNQRKFRREQSLWQDVINKHRKQIADEEKEQEELSLLYLETSYRLNEERRRREFAEREEVIRKRIEMQQKAVPPRIDYAKEEEIRLKALKEQEERYQNEEKEKQEKREKFKKELLSFACEADQRREARKKKELEERRWALLQRLALVEAYNALPENSGEEKLRVQDEMCLSITEQIIEKRIRENDKKLHDLHFFDEEKEIDKKKLLEYGEKILNYAKERNWPLYPIKKAMRDLKKIEGIGEETKTIPFLKSKVPIPCVCNEEATAEKLAKDETPEDNLNEEDNANDICDCIVVK